MQPSNREILDKCLKSEKSNRKQTQEHPEKGNTITYTDGFSKTEDFHDILVLNGLFQLENNECPSSNSCKVAERENHHEFEKKKSSQENVKVGAAGSCSSLQKVAEDCKTPGNQERPRLLQRKGKRKTTKSELRNIRLKRTEKTLVEEKNEIPKKLEKVSMERVVDTSFSENITLESDSTQEVVMSEETYSRSKKKNISQGQRRKGPRKNCLRRKVMVYKPAEHIGDTDETPWEGSLSEDKLIKIPKEGSPSEDVLKVWSSVNRATKEKEVPMENQLLEYQLELEKDNVDFSNYTKVNFHPQRTVTKSCGSITVPDKLNEDHQGLGSEEVCGEAHDDEVVTFTEHVRKEENREAIHSEDICQKVCNAAKSCSQSSNQPKLETTSHIISNNQIVSDSFSRENCDNIHPKRNAVNVKISTIMPEENQSSVLRGESLIPLHISFEIENVVINSAKFGITRENLKAIFSDEKKLELLTQILCSFLPSEYKNHEMFLESAIHRSFLDRGASPLLGYQEQDPQPTWTQEHSGQVPQPNQEKEYSEQGSQSNQEKEYSEQDTKPNDTSISEHNDQAGFTAETNPKEPGETVYPKRFSEKVSHQVTSKGLFSDHHKLHSTPLNIGHKQTTSPKKCEISFEENMIHVKISTRMPKKKHNKSLLTGESMLILEISFFLKNVLIHSTKLKITKKDLDCIHSDKAKLKVLKKKFSSLLPPKYKNYEMLVQLNDQDAVSDRSGTSPSM